LIPSLDEIQKSQSLAIALRVKNPDAVICIAKEINETPLERRFIPMPQEEFLSKSDKKIKEDSEKYTNMEVEKEFEEEEMGNTSKLFPRPNLKDNEMYNKGKKLINFLFDDFNYLITSSHLREILGASISNTQDISSLNSALNVFKCQLKNNQKKIYDLENTNIFFPKNFDKKSQRAFTRKVVFNAEAENYCKEIIPLSKDNRFASILFLNAKLDFVRNNNIQEFFIDGTARMVPFPGQLLRINFVHQQRSTPFMNIIMNGNTEQDYKIVFQHVERHFLFKNSTIHCDFETSLMNAVKNHIEGATIVPCFFHFKQALIRWQATKMR
jgi:hypothetical protein